jgi:hypothetical protein
MPSDKNSPIFREGVFFFFFPFNFVMFYTGDHSQEELAKFGYRSEWKVIF